MSEFCGAQHARMGLLVETVDEEAFAGWRLQRAVIPERAEVLPISRRRVARNATASPARQLPEPPVLT